MKIILRLFWALIVHIFNPFIKAQSKHWVFSSDRGNLYREGSKYLFEYMCENHPDFNCTYIVRNPNTYREIREKGLPVEMNFSWKGIMTILKADAVFYTQGPGDMYYGFKKKRRSYYYLLHGQSLKKIRTANKIAIKKYRRRWRAFLRELGYPILIGHRVWDSSFLSATSEFTIPFLKKSYGEHIPIKILGMPRNDGLFKTEEMEKERWLKYLNGKFVITYMPTHRLYGKGQVSPVPFIDNEEVKKWMSNNNVVLVVKQHPNMIPKTRYHIKNDVIVDVTKMEFDPQVIIYHSDVLISDYSSVWLDYLLLRRPIIHYMYDDFETEDIGLNIDMRKDAPGIVCRREEELFDIIKNIKLNYENTIPKEEMVLKYYKQPDGNTCERYYKAILEDKYLKQK